MEKKKRAAKVTHSQQSMYVELLKSNSAFRTNKNTLNHPNAVEEAWDSLVINLNQCKHGAKKTKDHWKKKTFDHIQPEEVVNVLGEIEMDGKDIITIKKLNQNTFSDWKSSVRRKARRQYTAQLSDSSSWYVIKPLSSLEKDLIDALGLCVETDANKAEDIYEEEEELLQVKEETVNDDYFETTENILSLSSTVSSEEAVFLLNNTEQLPIVEDYPVVNSPEPYTKKQKQSLSEAAPDGPLQDDISLKQPEDKWDRLSASVNNLAEALCSYTKAKEEECRLRNMELKLKVAQFKVSHPKFDLDLD